MRYHPQRAGRLRIVLILATLHALAGCSGVRLPFLQPEIPAAQFASLPDKPPGVTQTLRSLATDGKRIVMTGTVLGSQDAAQFLYSDDQGASWNRGAPTGDAAARMIPGESVGLLTARTKDGKTEWWGLASVEDHLYAWQSSDGKSWSRSDLVGIPTKDVRITAGAASAEAGFILVGAKGSNKVGEGNPIIWRSQDGINWSEQLVLETKGLFERVATRGATVSAGGAAVVHETEGITATTLLERSADGGTTWQPVPVAEPADSTKHITEATAVEATDSGFLIGGSFSVADGNCRPWIATSVDGAEWAFEVAPARAGDRVTVNALGHTAQGEVVVLEDLDARRGGMSVQVGDGSAWSAATLPVETDKVTHQDSLFTGDSTVLLAVSVDGTPNEGQLWRSTDGGRTFAKVDIAPPASAQPSVRPSILTAAAAYGTAQGLTVAWPRKSDGTYGPALVLGDAPANSLSGAVTGPGGSVVWGSFDTDGRGNAQTRFTADGKNFTISAPNEFNVVTTYHSSSISDVIWAHDRWLAVGDRTTNGSARTSALVFTSTDGVHWAQGSGTSIERTGDDYGDSDPLTDLLGLYKNGREMAAVAELKTGAVSVGRRYVDDVSHAAFWLSSDLEKWKLADLPVDGLTSSSASAVHASGGDTVVAIGSGMKEGATESTGMVWTSTDAGKTWTRQPLGPEAKAQPLLLAVAHGTFVIVQGQDSDRSLKGWTSKDGATWSPIDLDLPGRSDKTRVSVQDFMGVGDGVDLLLRVYNSTDARTVLNHVKIG